VTEPAEPARRLRIVLAIVRYFPHGGVQRHFRRLLAELVERGHEVSACASSFEGDLPEGVRRVLIEVPTRSNHGRNAAFAAALDAAYGDRREVDLVVGMTKLAGLDLYYCGDLCYRARIAERILAPLLRWTPRYRALAAQEEAVFGADRKTHIMTTAPAAIATYQQIYQTPDARFTILPPGLDLDRLARDRDRPFRPPPGLATKRRFVLMVGSGFHTKGVDRAIRALAALSARDGERPALVVVGEGKPRNYQRLARRLGIGDDVIFAGARDDVATFYARAELLLHPARLENTGNVLLEAMACGLPVLTLDSCGFATHVAAASAGRVLAAPFTQSALDEALRQFLADPPDLAAARRGAGPDYVARTPLTGLIRRAADLIEELAG
jgi:UDP-glucose:(heptosyl)LPS alpha-1,3-glucosyltransferase